MPVSHTAGEATPLCRQNECVRVIVYGYVRGYREREREGERDEMDRGTERETLLQYLFQYLLFLGSECLTVTVK